MARTEKVSECRNDSSKEQLLRTRHRAGSPWCAGCAQIHRPHANSGGGDPDRDRRQGRHRGRADRDGQDDRVRHSHGPAPRPGEEQGARAGAHARARPPGPRGSGEVRPGIQASERRRDRGRVDGPSDPAVEGASAHHHRDSRPPQRPPRAAPGPSRRREHSGARRGRPYARYGFSPADRAHHQADPEVPPDHALLGHDAVERSEDRVQLHASAGSHRDRPVRDGDGSGDAGDTLCSERAQGPPAGAGPHAVHGLRAALCADKARRRQGGEAAARVGP